MLQNQPSSNWRLMKYLITMPILAALIIFFALDFSKKLPESITEPFEKAADYVQLMEKITVVGYQNDQNFKRSAFKGPTAYQIWWQGKTCNCYPESEKTPNYYKCEGFSISKSLLTPASPFKLLKLGEPMPVNNLWIRTNSSFPLHSESVQMQELSNYEEGRNFLSAVPVGYTIRFNFETGKEAGFYFHAFVNNEQNNLQLTHVAQIGNEKINIDPMINTGSLTVDYETYKKMLDQPITLRMNDGTFRGALGMKVDIGYRYSSVLENKNTYRLKDFASAKWMAFPGDRITIHYYLNDDATDEIVVNLNIEQDKEWHRGIRDHAVSWDGKLALDPANIFLEPDQLQLFNGKKMEFVVNSKKWKVKHIGALSPDLVNGPAEKPYTQYVNIPGIRFQEMLDRGMAYLLSGGDHFSLMKVELENGLIYNQIRIYRIYEFDPASWYKTPQQASYKKDRRLIRLNNAKDLDISKLEALRLSSGFGPVLIVNGHYISSSDDRTRVFEQLQLSEKDEVAIYLPGAYPDNTPIKVPVGYIDINKDGFDVKAYLSNPDSKRQDKLE